MFATSWLEFFGNIKKERDKKEEQEIKERIEKGTDEVRRAWRED